MRIKIYKNSSKHKWIAIRYYTCGIIHVLCIVGACSLLKCEYSMWLIHRRDKYSPDIYIYIYMRMYNNEPFWGPFFSICSWLFGLVHDIIYHIPLPLNEVT